MVQRSKKLETFFWGTFRVCVLGGLTFALWRGGYGQIWAAMDRGSFGNTCERSLSGYFLYRTLSWGIPAGILGLCVVWVEYITRYFRSNQRPRAGFYTLLAWSVATPVLLLAANWVCEYGTKFFGTE